MRKLFLASVLALLSLVASNPDGRLWAVSSSQTEYSHTSAVDLDEALAFIETFQISPASNLSEPSASSCCRVCTKGKACGNSCISRALQCRQPPGCACDG